MTYREIQNQLKAFKTQGLTTIALNAKKEVLQAEYNRIMNSLIKEAIATEPEQIEVIATELAVIEVEAIPQLPVATVETVEVIATESTIEVTEVETTEEIEQDYQDLCDRISQEIEDIETEITTALPLATESTTLVKEITQNTPPLAVIEVIEVETTGSEITPQLAVATESDKFLTILTTLLTIFIMAIVKVYCHLGIKTRVAKILKVATEKMTTFSQWYFSGFNIPSFV